MSVYTHPSKTGWQLIKISHGRQGKPEYVPFQGSKDEALIFESELRGLTNRSDPDFSDHLPEFRIAYKNRSAKTSIDSIKYSFGHLEEFFGGYKLRHIKPSLIEQYKAKRLADGVKKRTVNVELSALSAYMRWINCNHNTEFDLPKLFTRKETKAPLPKVLTPDEIGSILANLDGDVRLIVEIMALCGLRRNEALNLQAKDIDLDGRSITVLGKGNKERTAPIMAEGVLGRLADLCLARPNGPLFPSPVNIDQGQARKDIRKPIRTAAKKAGITKEIRPHLFRHSFGAALINGGVDVRVIQELLGHSELSTTMLYTQVAGMAKRQAVAGLVAKVANPERP